MKNKLYIKTPLRRIRELSGKLYHRHVLGQLYDLGHGKERQIATKLRGIRADHKARYEFVGSHCGEVESVLDIACGIGYGSKILSRKLRCAEITGVDLSEFAISFAKRYYSGPNIKYICDDARKHAAGREFDVIVSFETLEHIDVEDEYLSLLRGLVNADGKLFISTPNQDLYPFDKTKNPFHVRHHTDQELVAVLRRNGWKVVSKQCQKDRIPGVVEDGSAGLFLLYVAEPT